MQMYLRATDHSNGRRTQGRVAMRILGVVWRAISLPFLALAVILEPVVTLVLAGLALFGVLTTIFFKLVGPPGFPAWTMLAISVGFGLALMAFHALIRLLAK
jgi:hypothetical protein